MIDRLSLDQIATSCAMSRSLRSLADLFNETARADAYRNAGIDPCRAAWLDAHAAHAAITYRELVARKECVNG